MENRGTSRPRLSRRAGLLAAASAGLPGPDCASARQDCRAARRMDVEPDSILVRQFAWREPDPLTAIDTLAPRDTFEIARPS
jgi:hypothetical protein